MHGDINEGVLFSIYLRIIKIFKCKLLLFIDMVDLKELDQGESENSPFKRFLDHIIQLMKINFKIILYHLCLFMKTF